MANAEIGALHSVHWGEGDCLDLCGMEVWLMYFDRTAQETYLQEVRDGMHTDKVDNYFYPTGRLATLLTMKPLYDPCGMLADYRALLTDYLASASPGAARPPYPCPFGHGGLAARRIP